MRNARPLSAPASLCWLGVWTAYLRSHSTVSVSFNRSGDYETLDLWHGQKLTSLPDSIRIFPHQLEIGQPSYFSTGSDLQEHLGTPRTIASDGVPLAPVFLVR